jgi:hypothetical protein
LLEIVPIISAFGEGLEVAMSAMSIAADVYRLTPQVVDRFAQAGISEIAAASSRCAMLDRQRAFVVPFLTAKDDS